MTPAIIIVLAALAHTAPTAPPVAPTTQPATPPTTQPEQQTRPEQPASRSRNPPAPGFDAAGSDEIAIKIADETMKAMGGRDAWDRARYLSWWFFGVRFHVWDRHTGDIRLEGIDTQTGEKYVTLMNVRTRKGRAWIDGAAVTNEAVLETALTEAYEAWINDSYWLVMPYKLKDSGVTLRSVGSGTTATGDEADVLELRFKAVGVTPQNKYRVYVGKTSRLVEQWDFYREASDESPRFSTPWLDWKRHGDIFLSGDRGSGRVLADVRVLKTVPDHTFRSPVAILLDEE